MNSHKDDFLSFPGLIDETFQVIRKNLLRKTCFRIQKGARLVLVNGQAGQGKSVFASQLVSALNRKPIFFRLKPDDRDPVSFIKNALMFFQKHFPDIEKSLVEKKISTGELTKGQSTFAWEKLLETLDGLAGKRTVLIYEDLQTIDRSPTHKILTQAWLGQHEARMLSIVTTRRNLFLKAEQQQMQTGLVYIGNRDLAFSRLEVSELLNRIYKIPADQKMVNTVHRQTEGWVMGLAILSRSLRASSTPAIDYENIVSDQLWHYFVSHVFDCFPVHVQKHWLYLSLLEDVPGELALIICRPFDVVTKLLEAAEENQFVRLVDVEKQWFQFHQIYRDVLRELAQERLTEEELGAVRRQAASWFWKKRFVRRCMDQLAQLEDYEAIDRLLKKFGPQLHQENRIQVISDSIAALPRQVKDEHAYIGYCESLTLFGRQPLEACQRMYHAHQLAKRNKDGFGHLITIDVMITWFVIFKKGMTLTHDDLKSAAQLYNNQKRDLADELRAHVANSLALGYCFIMNAFKESHAYIESALKLAARKEMTHLIISLRATRAFCLFYEGRHGAYATELETLLKLVQNRFLSNENHHLLVFLQLLYLGDGDHPADFKVQKKLAVRKSRIQLKREPLKPLVLFCELRAAILAGDMDEGHQLMAKILADDQFELSAPLAVWQRTCQTYLAALSGNPPRDAKPADIGAELAGVKEGGLFYLLSLILFGGTCRLRGDFSQAHQRLDEALQRSVGIGARHYEYSTHAHLALLYTDMQESHKAQDALSAWLTMACAHGYNRFIGGSPMLLRQLLQSALDQAIFPQDAHTMACRYLGLNLRPFKPPLPILRLNTLGRFELSDLSHLSDLDGQSDQKGPDQKGGGRVLSTDQISAEHRRLLAVLMATRESRIPMADLCQLLWPKIDPIKARSRVNTSLSRLRSQLGRFIPDSESSDYIHVLDEIVQLSNVETDVQILEAHAHQGFWLAGQGFDWRACIAFDCACRVWSDVWFPDMLDEKPIAELSRHLKTLYHQICLEWSICLTHLSHYDQALAVIKKGLQTEPLSHDLWRQHYRVGLLKNDAPYVRKILDDYASTLRDHEFDQDEIVNTLNDIKSESKSVMG